MSASEVALFVPDLSERSKGLSTVAIIGTAVGAAVPVLAILGMGIYIFMLKKKEKTTAKNSRRFGSREIVSGEYIRGGLKLKGTRYFTFEDLKQATSNFSTQNEIGSGGYGKVYRGLLAASGQMVAVKRAKAESLQGVAEFKTEIELLSRVHQKNLVGLIGFCFEGENMLVYEFMPNGSLRDNLSGVPGPYCMTHQLTLKSNVYSYGVVLLEILTSRLPIEGGKDLVREVRIATERGGLNALERDQLLDTILRNSPITPSVLESFVSLALRCCEDYGANRPKLSEVVKELEFMANNCGANDTEGDAETEGGFAFRKFALRPSTDSASASFYYSGNGGYAVPPTVEPM